jgi:hypothetical protein
MAPEPIVAEPAEMAVPASRSSAPGVKLLPETWPMDRVPVAYVPVSATSPVTEIAAALAGPAMTEKPLCDAAKVTLSLRPGATAAGVAPVVVSCRRHRRRLQH